MLLLLVLSYGRQRPHVQEIPEKASNDWFSRRKVLFVPPRVCFPVPCKFWQLYGRVNGDLLQEGWCHTQLCCTQSPCPWNQPLLTRTSTGDSHMLKIRSGSVAVGSLVWALWVSLVGMGFDSKCGVSPPTILLGLLLCPWMWGVFFWWDPTFSCW